MASSDGKSASRVPKSLSGNLPIDPRKVANQLKSIETQPPGRSISASQPKKAIKDTTSASAIKKASHSSNEAKQGIDERRLSRDHLNGHISNKIRVGIRGRRRGYHVTGLPSRRRAFTYRGNPSKLDFQQRRKFLELNSTRFPLLNLEEYIKQRDSSLKGATHIVEDMESPNSHLSCLQKSSLMTKYQRLLLVGESPSSFVDISLKDQQLLAKFSVHTYVSADEANNVASQSTLDKSRYDTPLHWLANHHTSKNESLLHYAGSCFSVSRRHLGGKKRQVAYMYNSERSLSCFGSDTEMAPLMTEPEPFNEISDDQSASSVALEAHRPRYVGDLTYNGTKDIHSCIGGICTHKASSIKQNLAIKKPSDTACKHRSISQKYRPKSFKDLLGQKIVVESLSNAILRSKIAPVYLFHGPRGTGKTTAAKIFTCAMNCLSIEELRPCGLCKECTSFNAGNNYDVKEVDAAGNNEIESMMIMVRHLCLPPSRSRYKVFMMDDCDMLTPEAWNALLKSLEEPPEYLVFIFVTANLEQLPRAAISRCQKYIFNRVNNADIIFRLKNLAHQENVEIDVDALHFIAVQSDGSLRDAEMMLDQLSLLGKKVTLGTVRDMVGLIPENDLIDLLEMALSADTVNTVHSIRELMGCGVEPLALTSQLAALITDILAGKFQNARYSGMKARKDQQDKLQQALKVLSDLEMQLRSCSDRTTWLTAAFLQFASNNSHPFSSRGTSITQSPAMFLDMHEKETPDFDGAGRRYSLGGKEKWDVHHPLQMDHQQEYSLCKNSSGSFMDNQIFPCDHPPQLGTSMDEKAVCKSPDWTSQDMRNNNCKSPDWTSQDMRNNNCSILSPCSMNKIWQKVVHGSSSNVLNQLLQEEGKLVSISITEGFAIARLEFISPQHKSMAERFIQNISNAFQTALFCPVKVEISLCTSQGRRDFTCGGSNQSIHIHSEHHSVHLLEHQKEHQHEQNGARGGSIRMSSFRNMEFATLSSRYHDLKHRMPVQSINGDVRTHSKRNSDTSLQNLQVYNGQGEFTSCMHQKSSGGYVSEHHKFKEQKHSFIDPKLSQSLRWSDTREDMEYSLDSEVEARYAPGFLCWRGTRTKSDGGKQHVPRRRRARFLLRMVPCAKEEEDQR